MELSPEELEAVNGGLLDDIAEFGRNVWKKVKDVVIRMKDWG